MTQTEWLPVPGIRLAAVEAGIKKANRKDLVLLELAEGSRVSGVFTLNRFCAAPVQVAKSRLAAEAPKYLMINTGYANAGTGKKGMENCLASCRLLAEAAGCREDQILPYSTGVIGEQFPLPAFEKGLPNALAVLDEHHWGRASEGIMTTDTQPKGCSRRIEIAGQVITITGISKGAGMIRPNMATMLGYVATDAPVAQPLLQSLLREAADLSFNRITIDGDTSTNDSCMLVATGKADIPLIDSPEAQGYEELATAIKDVMLTLAQAIVRDGEGATKFVTIRVNGGANNDECLDVAYAVAHSPLIKTALFASDPNWGRILAAVGYAGVPDLDVEKIDVYLDDVCITRQGGRAAEYEESQGARVMGQSEITIRIELGRGEVSETLWTTDLSHEYVRINAEYRT